MGSCGWSREKEHGEPGATCSPAPRASKGSSEQSHATVQDRSDPWQIILPARVADSDSRFTGVSPAQFPLYTQWALSAPMRSQGSHAILQVFKWYRRACSHWLETCFA